MAAEPQSPAAGCDAGRASDCTDLGLAYENGKNVPKDLVRAAELYRRACDLNDGWGCSNLGHFYEMGTGVNQDFTRAIALDQKACDLGNGRGCTSLGLMYEQGKGAPVDNIRAAELYRKSCDLGFAWGCSNLGYFYETGTGVSRDFTRAVVLHQKACDLGNGRGCNNLGLMYEKGQGVATNPTNAKALFQRACDLEYTAGCDNVRRAAAWAPAPARQDQMPAPPAASESTPYRLIPAALAFELGWANIALRPEAEDRLGVGAGNYIYLGLGAVAYEIVAVYVDAGLGGMSDRQTFRQAVATTYGGYVGTADSTVSAHFFSASVGLRTPRLLFTRGGPNPLAITGGADLGVVSHSASREISDCTDCRVDSLSTTGGGFYALRLAFGAGNPKAESALRIAGFGITYRAHASSSDLGRTLMISIGLY